MKKLAFLACALAIIGAQDASAYVRSRTTHGTATAWRSGCAMVQPDIAGTADLDAATTAAAIQRSMAAWRSAVAACSYFTIEYVAPAALDAHFDGINVIKFRTDKWCHPDDAHSSGICYDSVAAGITTVFYADHPGEDDDGTLLDADVELNNINFTFDIIDPITGPTKAPRANTTIADFENTLVHELGHLQGLDHTCKDSATPAVEVDENGDAPPACSTLNTLPADEKMKITEATMYNSAAPGETKKRTPEADDVAGICTAYPLASDPGSCRAADISGYTGGSGGCDFGGNARDFGVAGFLLLFAMHLVRTRRVYARRRPPQSP